MEVNFFLEEGHQVFTNVVDLDAISDVLAFLQDEQRVSEKMIRAALEIPEEADFNTVIADLIAKGNFQQFDHEMQQLFAGHFALKSRLSQRLWAIPQQPKVRAILEAVLQDNHLFMHMPPAARWVLPGYRHSAVPAHQDISYNKHISDFVTLWVPFVNIDDECGGVAIYKGSGKSLEIPTKVSDRFWLNSVTTNGFQRIHHSMNPGDILLLNKWIIHESMPNRSQRVRYSIDYRCFCSRGQSSKHYLDLQTLQIITPTGVN